MFLRFILLVFQNSSQKSPILGDFYPQISIPLKYNVYAKKKNLFA